jgi:antitoxin FitA
MPANLSLTGVSDEVVERLRQSAAASHRSLNGEIIARLSAQVLPRRLGAEDHLLAIRAVRERLAGRGFDHADIDHLKREGRR